MVPGPRGSGGSKTKQGAWASAVRPLPFVLVFPGNMPRHLLLLPPYTFGPAAATQQRTHTSYRSAFDHNDMDGCIALLIRLAESTRARTQQCADTLLAGRPFGRSCPVAAAPVARRSHLHTTSAGPFRLPALLPLRILGALGTPP